jgi:hypothetical protein
MLCQQSVRDTNGTESGLKPLSIPPSPPGVSVAHYHTALLPLMHVFVDIGILACGAEYV